MNPYLAFQAAQEVGKSPLGKAMFVFAIILIIGMIVGAIFFYKKIYDATLGKLFGKKDKFHSKHT